MSDRFFVPSTWNRLWARVVDGAVLLILLWPALREIQTAPNAPWLLVPWGYAVYILLVPWLYEALAVWLFQTTAGKWVYGLKVVSAEDDRHGLGLAQSLSRSLAIHLSFFIWFAGPALMWFRYDRTHLADWIAGSRVLASRARKSAVRPRILLATMVALFCVLGGLGSAVFRLNQISWDHQGLLFDWDSDGE